MSIEEEQDHAYFNTIPWCQDILKNPEFIARPTSFRHQQLCGETLFAKTLNTKTTIHGFLSLYKKQVSSQVDEVRTLISLGSDLDGHPQICHGGMISTIMDEVMGILVCVNDDLKCSGFGGTSVTAYLNTTYLKPVNTPQTLMVVARLQSVEGRKIFTEALILDEDEAVLAKATALFVRLREHT